MKIAVLCCGQLRSFLKCMESIEKHILSKNNCSLFVYTDTEIASSSTIQWNGKSYSLPKSGIDEIYAQSLLAIKKLVEKYNCNENVNSNNDFLDRIKVEPHFKIETPNWWDFTMGSFDGTYFNCFNKQQVFLLLQNYIKKYNFKFDYVLYIRPDVFVNEDIILEEEILKLPELQIENKLNSSGYIVMYSPITEWKNIDMTLKTSSLSRNDACDVLCWGPFESFSKIMPNITENLVTACKEIKGIRSSCFESAFWLVLWKENISRYVLYRDFWILRLLPSKLKLSAVLKVRIKKTSAGIFILRWVKFRSFAFAVVLFGYPIYFQIFSDKYVYISNYYERIIKDRR